jgi:type IV pilus assembly protein PilQ
MKKLLLVTACLLGCTLPDAAAQVANREARISLNLAERTLEDIVDYIRERSGANIELIDREGEIISTEVIRSIQLEDVHWRVALEIAAEKVGGVVEERKNGILIVTRPPPFIFSSKDGDIREIIGLIAEVSGANIIIAPEVVGLLSVNFTGVPWRVALDVVAKTRGYTVVEERAGVLRVVDPLLLQDQLVTSSYQLRFLRPKGTYVPVIRSEFIDGKATPPSGDVFDHFTVLRALTKALSTAGDLDYIEDQNVIIVRDTQQAHEQIGQIINALDVEPLQVFCDVKFVTTTNGDLLSLGVDYGDSGPSVSLSGGSIPVTFPFNPGGGGFEDLLIGNHTGEGPWYTSDPTVGSNFNDGGTFVPQTVFGALDFTQVIATLRLLQRDTSSEVIQAPKLVALDGRPATIFVGETIRYAEAKSEQGQAGGLQLSIAEAKNSPVEVGFQLLIRPNVIPGSDRIMMEVIPKETSLSGTGQSALAPPGFDVFTLGASGLEGSIALPRTRSSTIMTTMMLDSGQTAVIGGLTTDSEVETETRVPGLWRIPLLGELFRYQEHSIDKRSLMVFLTPTIVHSREDQEAILQQELGRRRAKLADEIDSLIEGGAEPEAATPGQ